jgi:S-DNA-T family DNA segregation ATPase FtsK/SpoIIIE
LLCQKLGSLKEQALFAAKLLYGAADKDFESGDGYLVVENKFTCIRCAVSKT